MKKLFTNLIGAWLIILFCQQATAQGTPEILYYRFNGTGTSVPNQASSAPSGTTATINGSLTQGGSSGVCGTSALVGSGNSGSTDYVSTNWQTTLKGSWTISFWTSNISASSTLFYIFGDPGATSFRCFTNGVAGANNWIVRGPFADVLITGGATTGSNVNTIVMDSAAGKIYAYLNGNLVNTVTQAAINVTSSGTFNFAYSSNVVLPANGLLDEFRFYSRALSASEVAKLVYGNKNTSATVSVTQPCGTTSYKSPSGKYTWTASGTYQDTITNTSSCDSLITINLTLKKASAGTATATVCDSYKSPSGKKTWTTSGTYKDTVPNSIGCDSVITINLTVKKSTTSTITPKACNTYKSPSGKYTWTTSGTYMDTIPNGAGCDSVITVNLTVNYSSAAIISPVACDSYMSPSGKNTWTTSGVYVDTIQTTGGCDSVLTINLTVNNSSTATITTTACNSYKSPSGNYTWTTSGIYMDTIPNGIGCDSIITVNLTVNYSSTSTITPIACDSYMSPSGKHTWTASGSYMDTIPNTAGCDSVITITLTINSSSASTISPTACISYTSPSGKHTWLATGNYKDTIPNGKGCDSVITINLTVNTPNITVTRFGFVLTSAATAATYQWLDCNNSYAVIPGETNQTFAVTANGSYAVQVTQNSCTDTSACMVVNNVGIREINAEGLYRVYPNPSGGQLTIAANQAFSNATVRVMSITGQTMLEKSGIAGNTLTLDITNEASGVYFIEIEEKGNIAKIKLVKF